MAGLKSKDASERLLTASLLISRYRTVKPGMVGPNFKTKPIDAKESKLILTTLAEAEWTQQFKFGEPNPQGLFFQLGVTDKDGWKQPANFQELPAKAKEWLKEHASTYLIQQYVAEKKDRKDDKKRK
jgi:hypothetical protein